MTMVGGFDVHRKQITIDYVDDDGLAPIHRSAVGAALNSIVCLDCGVRGGVRVGDRPGLVVGLFLWVFASRDG